MILLDQTHEWHLPSEVKASVVRMDISDAVHGAALGEVIYKIIDGDAKTHNAVFDKDNFNRVINAIRCDKLQSYLVILECDGGVPKFAGGTTQFSTVFTEWNGHAFEHYPAVYSEDTYVSAEMSEEFRKRTKCKRFPNGLGLGTYFTQERIRLSVAGSNKDKPFGMTSRARISENASDNKPIVNILDKLGATVDKKAKIGILKFEKDALKNYKKSLVFVETEGLASLSSEDGFVSHRNIFTTKWDSADEEQQIVATFTEAISTFSGLPVVRVQITSNNNLPEHGVLKDVLAALICAGQEEIEKRKWMVDETVGVLPTFRIHALNESEIACALQEIGANQRILGVRTMMPIALDFRKIPINAFGHKLPDAVPFVTTNSFLEAPVLVDALPHICEYSEAGLVSIVAQSLVHMAA